MLHILHKIISALNAAQTTLVEHGIRRAYNMHAKADAKFRRNLDTASDIEEMARRMRVRASDDLTQATKQADEHLERLFAFKGENYAGMIRENTQGDCETCKYMDASINHDPCKSCTFDHNGNGSHYKSEKL